MKNIYENADAMVVLRDKHKGASARLRAVEDEIKVRLVLLFPLV